MSDDDPIVRDDAPAGTAASSEPELSLTVGGDDAGARLDRFLAQPLGSRSRAVGLIDAGRVTVDGAVRQKRYALAVGSVVVVAAADRAVTSAAAAAADDSVPYAIAYQDEHLLVIDKPAGVVVHPAAGHWTGTLAQALSGIAAGGPDGSRAGIVHRLDRDTSGLIVVARSDEVHRALTRLLAARELRREYLALVDGRPEARTGTIDAPIGRDRRDRTQHSIDTDVPRDARTHFEIERMLPGSTLLRVVLETGRTHQIRVHLAAIGHPVCGDPQYGVAGRYGLRRQFLHAARLTFPHPVTGTEIDVRSELPADLVAALRLAEDDG
ncbi:MAG: RluA family pseudouridine synthase [Solirubrobacteraceae bacterium]